MAMKNKGLRTKIDTETARERRTNTSAAIRKQQREESLHKRRNHAQRLNEEKESLRTYSVDDIPYLMDGMLSNNLDLQLSSARELRRLMCNESKPPMQECVNFGAVPVFVRFLQQSDVQLQFEAAWALTNISSSEYTKVVVESGAIPHLVRLLNSPDPDTREQCAWCLGNIAGENSPYRNMVIQAGGLVRLIQVLSNPPSVTYLQNCIWALSNFCRGMPSPELNKISPAIPIFCTVIRNCMVMSAVVDSIWGLTYISAGNNAYIQAVLDTDILPYLINLLDEGNPVLILPILRLLGNISSGSDIQTDYLLRCRAISVLEKYLHSKKPIIRKEVCWTLSNIAAGTQEQANQLISYPGLLSKCVFQLSSSSEFHVRKEARFIISNLVYKGQEEWISQLIAHGIISVLFECIDLPDIAFVQDVLMTIEKIFQCYSNTFYLRRLVDDVDGISKLEALQDHENQRIYERSIHILETYFEVEEEASPSVVAPAQNGSTFCFGFVEKSDKNNHHSKGFKFNKFNIDMKENVHFNSNPSMNSNFGKSFSSDTFHGVVETSSHESAQVL